MKIKIPLLYVDRQYRRVTNVFNDTALARVQHSTLAVLQHYRLMLMVMLVAPGLSHAADGKCYELAPRATGQFAMCKELVNNLNEFCDEQPAVCELKISPNHPKLSLLKWKELGVNEDNLKLAKRLLSGSHYRTDKLNNGGTARIWDSIQEQLDNKSIAGKARFSVAEVDALNRGKKELVYRLDTGFCPLYNFGFSRNQSEERTVLSRPTNQLVKTGPYVFLGRHAEILDNADMRARIAQNEEPFPGAKQLGSSAEIFLYEGRAFLFQWDFQAWVQEIRTNRRTTVGQSPTESEDVADYTVCQIRYRDTVNKSIQKKRPRLGHPSELPAIRSSVARLFEEIL